LRGFQLRFAGLFHDLEDYEVLSDIGSFHIFESQAGVSGGGERLG
jgi:hypothetical protein